MWGKKVEFSLQHRRFPFSILIGITVLVCLHHMTAGFGMCLPIDRASHLLMACSPCFTPEMYAKSFWRHRLPATGGPLCLLHCLEESSLGCYFEIWNYMQKRRGEIYLFFPAPFLLFPDICLLPGFPPFLGSSVPAILLFFCFLLFHLEIFFIKHYLLCNLTKLIDLCKYFQISATLQHYPYALSGKKKGRKKTPKNQSELNPSESCNWETLWVWICNLMTNFPKYLPTPNCL